MSSEGSSEVQRVESDVVALASAPAAQQRQGSRVFEGRQLSEE